MNWEHGLTCPASHGIVLVRFVPHHLPLHGVGVTFGLMTPFNPPGPVSPSWNIDLTTSSLHSSFEESHQLAHAIYGDRLSESAYRPQPSITGSGSNGTLHCSAYRCL